MKATYYKFHYILLNVSAIISLFPENDFTWFCCSLLNIPQSYLVYFLHLEIMLINLSWNTYNFLYTTSSWVSPVPTAFCLRAKLSPELQTYNWTSHLAIPLTVHVYLAEDWMFLVQARPLSSVTCAMNLDSSIIHTTIPSRNLCNYFLCKTFYIKSIFRPLVIKLYHLFSTMNSKWSFQISICNCLA